MKANLKDFREIKLLNITLTKQLEQEKLSLKDALKKIKTLETEKERMLFEIQTLKVNNTQMEKSLSINNNYEEIQHVITELNIMLLHPGK